MVSRWRGLRALTCLTGFVLVVSGCGSAQSPQPDLADGSDAAVAKVVDAITTFPDRLDSRIWDGTAMKPDVSEAITRVVERLVADADIDGLTVDAVELFGSNASYEYDDRADVGVHVFVHASQIADEQLTPLLRMLNDQVERRQEGRILLYGLPLEVTFHAGRSANYQPRPGIGQYSVSDHRWIVEPVRQPDHFDRAQMTAEAKRFIGEYNRLVNEYHAAPKGFVCSRFGALDREMSAYRDQGFARGLGSRSTQNLTYRALRRLNVDIPEMVDTLEDECTFTNESVG